MAQNDTFSVIIARYEDFIFHTNEIMKQLCECVGKSMTNNVITNVFSISVPFFVFIFFLFLLYFCALQTQEIIEPTSHQKAWLRQKYAAINLALPQLPMSFNHISALFDYHAPKIEYYRTAIALELSTRRSDILELHAMVFPSWNYVNKMNKLTYHELLRHPQICFRDSCFEYPPNIRMVLDLVIYCEPKACKFIPITCHSVNDMQQVIEKSPKFGRCFFESLDEQYTNRTLSTGIC